MRRRASLVLLALAFFFAAMAPLLRWYAFPRLAKVPPSQYQEVVLEAKDAILLDYYGGMKAKKVPKVTIVQTLKGNVEASEEIEKSAGRDVVVWDTLTHVVDDKGRMVSQIPERYIFDAHSQAPVHATGESVDGAPVKREGIEFKWPFLTEKRDYEYFDAQARITAPIRYEGTRKFRGMEVYYFEQTVPWQQVPMPRKMPIPDISAEAVAQTGMTRWYTTKRMFWVDPVTGAPVNGEEIINTELRNAKKMGLSEDTVTAFAGHVKMREDYVAYTVDLVKSQRTLVLLLTSYLPWGFGALAVVLIALSLWLEARARRPDEPAGEPEPEFAINS